MRKFAKAFTLAEVLITLAIVGIVAALTIPTLITDYQKRVTAVKVRKSYAELSQALRLAQAEYGDINTWKKDFSSDNAENSRAFAENYITPYMKIAKYCGVGSEADENCGIASAGVYSSNYLLINGTGLSIAAYNASGIINLRIIVNMKTGKNKIPGTDSFDFVILPDAFEKGILPYGYTQNITREEIKSGYTVNYEDRNHQTNSIRIACLPVEDSDYNEDTETYVRHSCTYLLFVDNFVFKEDYPY